MSTVEIVMSTALSGISISIFLFLVTHTSRARCEERSATDSLTSYTASSNNNWITARGRGGGGKEEGEERTGGREGRIEFDLHLFSHVCMQCSHGITLNLTKEQKGMRFT